MGAGKRGTIEATYREEMEKRDKVERSKETGLDMLEQEFGLPKHT